MDQNRVLPVMIDIHLAYSKQIYAYLLYTRSVSDWGALALGM